MAEKAAWDHELVTSGKGSTRLFQILIDAVKLVVINPGFVLGRITNKRHATGTPSKWLAALKGEWTHIPNRCTVPVDVEDVARAHIRAFEDDEAEGRYPCVFATVTHQAVIFYSDC